MADIVLINPRFEVSFWGMEHALPLLGKRANMPVACLPLLAALTPPEHRVTLIDENVEAIDFERCAKADIVGVTGMIVQRQRMREILAELKHRGVFVVVGGPWVTVKEDYFDDLADVIFIGEAEETWPQFLSDWEAGAAPARYEQAEKTDMTQGPDAAVRPAQDAALRLRQRPVLARLPVHSASSATSSSRSAASRGSRPPRRSSPNSTRCVAQNMSLAFIVDDNLIGNKKAIKEVLRDVIAWQKAHGYPITFFTEASIDLADDAELMDLMVEANIVSRLRRHREPQRGIAARDQEVPERPAAAAPWSRRSTASRTPGMEVWCGMILGFDNDDESDLRRAGRGSSPRRGSRRR